MDASRYHGQRPLPAHGAGGMLRAGRATVKGIGHAVKVGRLRRAHAHRHKLGEDLTEDLRGLSIICFCHAAIAASAPASSY